jgi:hypothetical protein
MGGGLLRNACVVGVPGRKRGLRVGGEQAGVVVEHLLEVRDQPASSTE